MRILKNLSKFALEGRTALVDGTGSISFENLDIRSNAVALWLSENMPAQSPVAICGDKEHDMACCIFGALKSSHPYVIIPGHYPAGRADEILRDAGADAVFQIGDPSLHCSCSRFFSSGDIDTWVEKYRGRFIPETMYVQPDDICCIFYTSGSTGIPKGVQISRRNIETYLDWWETVASAPLPATGGRAVNFASYAFCASIGNLFYLLAEKGMTLYSVGRDLAMDYSRLYEYIRNADPVYQAGTPSFYSVCLKDPNYCREYLPNLNFIVSSGEPLSAAIARELLERFPDVYLCNKYGTTETTIGTISCRVTGEMLDNTDNSIPIGVSSPESEALILDENHNVLPEGRTGELAIISGMVSCGYLHSQDRDRLRQRFFTAQDGRRGYYTGDLVFRKNNLIYYEGRMDNLVKAGGYRVELEDVEKNILRIPMIRDCAVIPVMSGSQVSMLAAYIVLKEPVLQKLPAVIAIKKEMSLLVPPYMIPQKIVILDELPKNISNKTDRFALREKENLPCF